MPWVALAAMALILAGLFAAGFGVPRDRPAGIRGLSVRWGHPLVWLFLGGMFIALAADVQALVAPLGLLAGAGYVTYLAALLTSSPGRRRRRGSGP